METKHTPGPWKFKFLHEKDDGVMELPALQKIFDAVLLFYLDAPTKVVFRLKPSPAPPNRADMALIMAAPDLLIALQRLLAFVGQACVMTKGSTMHTEESCSICNAKSIVAKTT